MSRPRKPHLPPLQLPPGRTKGQAFGRNRSQTPSEMDFDDLHDDVRDLVIGSPLPQLSRPETSTNRLSAAARQDVTDSSSEFPPAIRVHSSDETLAAKAAGGGGGASMAAATSKMVASPESTDNFHDVGNVKSLSPSPKLFRRKNQNHVKYFMINDEKSSTAASTDVDDVTTWMTLKGGQVQCHHLETSPSHQRRPIRLSPILSPSSMSPNLSPHTSPRTSPMSSPRTQRKKERISADCSPVHRTSAAE